MKLSEFDYDLPKELIAQYPAEKRDASRMMVLDKDGRTLEHKNFNDLIEYLTAGDCIVLNDTKVIPARLMGKSETGGKAEIFILERLAHKTFKALIKPAGRLANKKIYFKGNTVANVLKIANPESVVEFEDEIDLNLVGSVPLPPYIKREPQDLDRDRYQTVFAAQEGATAAPTAGLHFTNEILDRIRSKGAHIAYVTLHVSYGTFAPVLEEEIENHKMHDEHYELQAENAEKIKRAKRDRKKVVAVGTTVTRVLEADSGQPTAAKARTNLFIYPGYKFKVIDALLTNFHIPKSTLMMLVSAFAGREFVLKAYEEAIRSRYRFFSYGDCMLIM